MSVRMGHPARSRFPFGNDNQKGDGNSRFPSGMTTRRARTNQRQKQIPFGNDNQKGNSKGDSESWTSLLFAGGA